MQLEGKRIIVIMDEGSAIADKIFEVIEGALTDENTEIIWIVCGNPTRNSRFNRLQIGMSARQVTDIAGQPTDQGAYVTGKAFIPFYFGGDRHRYEMTYKGQGRLVFAGGGMGDYSGGNLIWIIHNPNETGYR